jgi:hypothetical protein
MEKMIFSGEEGPEHHFSRTDRPAHEAETTWRLWAYEAETGGYYALQHAWCALELRGVEYPSSFADTSRTGHRTSVKYPVSQS